MKLNLLLPVLAITFFISCNNDSEKKKEAMDDTARMRTSQDDHTHMASSSNVPGLPAIPEGSRVFFENLKDGDVVSSPLKIKMGTEKIRVDTANLIAENSGHHHLMIDGKDMIPLGETIPKDSLHIHFGKAQTETEVTLAPGKHKLTLQFADGLHRSYGEKLAASITVNVKK